MITSFIGGFNSPTRTRVGRYNLTTPLARLEIYPARIEFHARGPWKFITRPCRLGASMIKEAYPLDSTRGAQGVGITYVDKNQYYFWTSEVEAVLLTLESIGVPTSRKPRDVGMGWLWNNRGSK